MADKPDYDLMEVGREMDALVAEKVMGWDGVHNINYVDDDTWYSSCANCGLTGNDDDIRNWEPGNPPLRGCKVPPRYSKYISAAWDVVEKLKNEFSFSFHHAIPLSGVMRGWWAGFGKGAYPPDRFGVQTKDNSCWANAEEFPLAICRAALKAVG